jgi:hypothetical protein
MHADPSIDVCISVYHAATWRQQDFEPWISLKELALMQMKELMMITWNPALGLALALTLHATKFHSSIIVNTAYADF